MTHPFTINNPHHQLRFEHIPITPKPLSNPFLTEYLRRVSEGQVNRDERQINILKHFPEFAESASGAQEGQKRGVYLWGGVGTGKSMLLGLLHDQLPLHKKRWIHFHSFMLDVHKRIHKQKKERRGDPIPAVAQAIARETQALFLDEFQVADPADAIILSRLFSALIANGVWVASSSNTAPERLYADGINRPIFLPFIDLVGDQFHVSQIDGNDGDQATVVRDYRQKMGPPEPGAYVYPLGSQSDRALEDTFSRVTGTDLADAEPTVVAVMNGRTLKPPPRAVGGVAFVEFNDLCKGATGASDYLALAKAFHTVFLRGVPSLESDQPQAARFVNLIDVLYEQQCRLVVSAALPPAQLLRGSVVNDAGRVSGGAGHKLPRPQDQKIVHMVGKGGASARFSSTYVDDMEWSATGLVDASLADFSNANKHVAHSFRRAASRLEEMRSHKYWNKCKRCAE